MRHVLNYEIHHIKDGFITNIICDHFPQVKDLIEINEGETYEVVKRLWIINAGTYPVLRVFVDEIKI